MKNFIILALLSSCSHQIGLQNNVLNPKYQVNLDVKSSNTTGVYDPVNSVSYSPNNFVKKSFKFILNTKKKVVTTPLIVGEEIFILSEDGFLSCFSLSTKSRNWSIKITNNQITAGGITYNEGLIYVSTGGKEVVCINSKTGREVFRNILNDMVRQQPVVGGKELYVLNSNNQINAFSKKTGKLIWMSESAPESLTTIAPIAPIAFANSVLVPYSNGQVAVFNSENGSQVWSMNFSADSDEIPGLGITGLEIQPIVKWPNIYLSSSYFYSIDLSSGIIKWRQKIQDITQALVSGNTIFVLTNNHEILALETNTGNIVWKSSIDYKKKAFQFLNPIIMNDKLYIISNIGEAFIFDPKNGSLEKRYSIPKNAVAHMNVSDKHYIITSMGEIFND